MSEKHYIKIYDNEKIYSLNITDVFYLTELNKILKIKNTSIDKPYVISSFNTKIWKFILTYIDNINHGKIKNSYDIESFRSTNPMIIFDLNDYKLFNSVFSSDEYLKTTEEKQKKIILLAEYTNAAYIVGLNSLHEKLSAYIASILENIDNVSDILKTLDVLLK